MREGLTGKGKKHEDKDTTPSEERPTMRREVAVAKLRLYLAQRMLQAVRCSPNGGFGVPVDCVRQEMSKEFGSELVDGLFGNSSANAVILSECGDVVELMPLRVQQLTKNGCVPSVQFRRDSTNVEAKIRLESLAIIAKAEDEEEVWRMNHPHLCPPERRQESGVEGRHPESGLQQLSQVAIASCDELIVFQKKHVVEGGLHQRVRTVLTDMMEEVLTQRSRFPSTLDFVERFKRKVGTDLDPLTNGFPSVLEMLQNMDMEDLVWFTEYDGTVYLVPSSQAYNNHRLESSLENKIVHPDNPPQTIPPPPPRPDATQTKARRGSLQDGIKLHKPSLNSMPAVDFWDEELDEFDVEILNKLRNLFKETVCTDRRPIPLNRLPLIFLRRCGTVLDYQKYGFINLTDVVALLGDVVKVNDSSKGKVIVPVEASKPLSEHGAVTSSVQTSNPSSPIPNVLPAVTSSLRKYGPTVMGRTGNELGNEIVRPAPDSYHWTPVDNPIAPARWAMCPGTVCVPPGIQSRQTSRPLARSTPQAPQRGSWRA